jgi:hypothetical protein
MNSRHLGQSAGRLLLVVLLLAATRASQAVAKKKADANPDFTKGQKAEAYHDYNLGPTGARGWIYGKGATADARQILVTQVAKGSPADEVLEVGDVILGVGGKPFGSDAKEYLPLLTRLEQHIKKVGEGYGRKYQVHKIIPPMIPPVRAALSSERGHPSLRHVKVKVPDYSAVKGLKQAEAGD